MLRSRNRRRRHKKLQTAEEDAVAYWTDRVKAVVQVKDDSRRLYPALKCLAHMRKEAQKKDDLFVDGLLIADDTTKAALLPYGVENQQKANHEEVSVVHCAGVSLLPLESVHSRRT